MDRRYNLIVTFVIHERSWVAMLRGKRNGGMHSLGVMISFYLSNQANLL